MPQSNPDLDAFFASATKWPAELAVLRGILLDAGLTEERKWDVPCYPVNGRLVVGIGELADCCAFSFFKGVLLADGEGILTKPGANTRSARMVRFHSVEEIRAAEPTLRAYLAEAVALEKAGRKVDFGDGDDIDYPDELIDRLDADPDFQEAFEALTPGRRRGYLLHFSSAKQPATRLARIAKATPAILRGKGLNDR